MVMVWGWGQVMVLVVGRAARFVLFAASGPSTSRPGDMVTIDDETLHRLPPVATTLDAGDASELPVVLEGEIPGGVLRWRMGDSPPRSTVPW